LPDKELTDMPLRGDPKTLPYSHPQPDREYVEGPIACNIAAEKEAFGFYGCFSPFLEAGRRGVGEDTEASFRLRSGDFNGEPLVCESRCCIPTCI